MPITRTKGMTARMMGTFRSRTPCDFKMWDHVNRRTVHALEYKQAAEEWMSWYDRQSRRRRDKEKDKII